MFSILSAKGVMGARLSKPDREAFLKDHGASLYAYYGTGDAGSTSRYPATSWPTPLA